jgi:hypothetical protein
MIILETNPSKTKLVVGILKEKEDEIQRLKKKLQMTMTQHSNSP